MPPEVSATAANVVIGLRLAGTATGSSLQPATMIASTAQSATFVADARRVQVRYFFSPSYFSVPNR